MPRRGYQSVLSFQPFFRPKVYVVFTGLVLPQVLSSQIGDTGNNIVVVQFTQTITSSNFSMGVTIKINGVPASISSAVPQGDNLAVIYTLNTSAKSNSTVNYVYSDVVGDYTNSQSGPLGAVNITVTNNVGRIMRFTDAPNSTQLWKL